MRTALNHIVNDEKNPLTGRLSSDGAAAKMAMEKIDQYIETKPELADIAQVARINYRAAGTAKELEAQTGEAITRGKTWQASAPTWTPQIHRPRWRSS